MISITREQLEEILDYSELIETLREGFQANYVVPKRHHHNFENPKEGIDSTLLLMPAWEIGEFLGVKMAIIAPQNGKYNLPAVHSIYTLFNAHTGQPIAQIDADVLTTQRTAATSALASSYLSRKNSKTLLMVGTGKMAVQLIQAHTAIRPIDTVCVWGRNFEKTKSLVTEFSDASFEIFPIKKIEEGIEKADIISCATLSQEPLVFGKNLKAGQHLDLVGAYLPNMREADDEAVRRSSVFVDTYDGSTESGDIVIPLKNGTLDKTNIQADLFELCRNEKKGRKNNNEITFFKSVGHALEDLAAAKLFYKKCV